MSFAALLRVRVLAALAGGVANFAQSVVDAGLHGFRSDIIAKRVSVAVVEAPVVEKKAESTADKKAKKLSDDLDKLHEKHGAVSFTRPINAFKYYLIDQEGAKKAELTMNTWIMPCGSFAGADGYAPRDIRWNGSATGYPT